MRVIIPGWPSWERTPWSCWLTLALLSFSSCQQTAGEKSYTAKSSSLIPPQLRGVTRCGLCSLVFSSQKNEKQGDKRAPVKLNIKFECCLLVTAKISVCLDLSDCSFETLKWSCGGCLRYKWLIKSQLGLVRSNVLIELTHNQADQ